MGVGMGVGGLQLMRNHPRQICRLSLHAQALMIASHVSTACRTFDSGIAAQVNIEPFTVLSGDLQARLLPLAEQLVVNFRTKIPEAAAEYCTSLGSVLFRTLREMRREPIKLQQHAEKLALLQQLQVCLRHAPCLGSPTR